jgi:nucleotide-binding universal stress UspA family protein
MFSKILVAYNESPESGRALLAGIHLAKSFNAELKAVTVQENLPPYVGYIDAEVPGGTRLFRQQAADYYRDLQTRAQQPAEREGVILMTELAENDEVETIVECMQRNVSGSILGSIENWEQQHSLGWRECSDGRLARRHSRECEVGQMV